MKGQKLTAQKEDIKEVAHIISNLKYKLLLGGRNLSKAKIDKLKERILLIDRTLLK